MLFSRNKLSKIETFAVTITVIGQQVLGLDVLNIISDSAMYHMPQDTF